MRGVDCCRGMDRRHVFLSPASLTIVSVLTHYSAAAITIYSGMARQSIRTTRFQTERSTQVGEAMRSSNRIPFKWRRASREVAPEMSFYFSYTSSVRSKRGVTPIIQRSADVLRARLEGPGAAWIFVRHRKHRSYGISGAVLAFRGL